MASNRIAKGATTFPAPNAGDLFYITEGGSPITGNVDGSAVNSYSTAEIGKGFTGTIGSESAPWKQAFSVRLVHAGGGALYHNNTSLDTAATALVQILGGAAYYLVGGSAAVTRLEVVAGSARVDNGATGTTIRVGAKGSANLLDTGTGAAITTMDVWGQAYTERPHTTVNVYSGVLSVYPDQAGATNAHMTWNVYGGIVRVIEPGTLTTLNWYGGLVDASRLQALWTITNSTVNCSLPGAQAFLDNPLITFTNATTRIMEDGRQL